MLANLLGQPGASLRVLDGGCGTGLCGDALRPWASHLIGVDISSAMLAKASQKGNFDELIESELTQFLQPRTNTFDLIVFADTLIYFGDLHDILCASAKALDQQGSILFNLEASHNKVKTNSYNLHPNGRYTHSANYVEKTLRSCGFEQISINSDSVRQEIGKPVKGLVVSARMK